MEFNALCRRRELDVRLQWEQTCYIVATIANVNRPKNRKPYTVADLMPKPPIQAPQTARTEGQIADAHMRVLRLLAARTAHRG